MPSRCEFKLDDENAIYYAGSDFITGSIILETSTTKNVEYIDIGFEGECKVINIVKSESDSKPAEELPIGDELFAKECYANEIDRVQSEGALEPGTHTWTFRFKVPETCVTSLEGPNGHIRYQVYLKIKNKTKYNNFFVKPVTVIRNVDLNLDPVLNMSQACEMNASCCFGNFRFKLFCCLSTPLSAYAPGQTIRYVLKLYEKTANKIDHYLVQFVRKMKFKTFAPRPYIQRFKTVLCERDVMDNGSNFQVAIGEIEIPSIPPTTHTKCITLEYLLVLKAKLNISATQFSAKVPIVIGTVPIKQSLLPEQEHLAESVLVQNLFGGSSMRHIITTPAFERAAQLDAPFKDIERLQINRVDNFLPMYPSYKFVPAEN